MSSLQDLNFSDDIIVYGKMAEDLPTSLQAAFERLQSHGLILNKDKRLLNQTKLAYFGFLFSADGVSPDLQKVAAIKNAPPPRSVKNVRTFLGMITYCSKFIQSFNDITQLLCDLMKNSTQFTWTTKHVLAFPPSQRCFN